MTITKLYNHPIPEWDEVEIHPIKDEATMDEYYEDSEEQPDYWCVYLHLEEGGIQEFADVPTLEDAQQLEDIVYELAQSHILHYLRANSGCINASSLKMEDEHDDDDDEILHDEANNVWCG